MRSGLGYSGILCDDFAPVAALVARGANTYTERTTTLDCFLQKPAYTNVILK